MREYQGSPIDAPKTEERKGKMARHYLYRRLKRMAADLIIESTSQMLKDVSVCR